MNSLSKLMPAAGLVLALLAAPLFAAETGSVHILTRLSRDIPFEVEVARTPAEQTRGLMFREQVPPGTGMLFPVDPPEAVGFWMKDTFVSLDMLFIGEDGKIDRIAARTVPRSLEVIPSGGKVTAVLEIAGGEAERLGIKVGDKVLK